MTKHKFWRKCNSITEKRWLDLLEKLTKMTELIFTVPDRQIVKQGQRDLSGMYTIISGRCKVFLKEFNPDTKMV